MCTAIAEAAAAECDSAYEWSHTSRLGRVDVAFLPDGTGLVSWMERTELDADIRVRRIDATGRVGPARVVSATTEHRTSGFPRMVAQGGELTPIGNAQVIGEGSRYDVDPRTRRRAAMERKSAARAADTFPRAPHPSAYADSDIALVQRTREACTRSL